MSAAPVLQSTRFETLSDPGVNAYFEAVAASGPATARALPKLVRSLVAKPWASRLPATCTRQALWLGDEGGARAKIAFWQHVQTFQVHFIAEGGAETLVGQGVHAGLVERMVSEAAARLLS